LGWEYWRLYVGFIIEINRGFCFEEGGCKEKCLSFEKLMSSHSFMNNQEQTPRQEILGTVKGKLMEN